ncbi:MAG TPA: amidohydrolase family protein [Kiritimatiellia bacterium]|nr:amidohydrolase family protein [Kiritimatiellia bacterium]
MSGMKRLLVRGGMVLTMDDESRILPGGFVYVEGDEIKAVGGAGDPVPEADRVVEGEGCVVMPGLINAHHHLYSTLACGFTPPGEPARNFQEILERLWWKLDAALNGADVYASSAIALLQAARWGCTTVIDHHASPGCVEGSLDEVERAFRDVGLNGCLCYEVSDRNREGEGIEENERFLRKLAEAKDDQIAGLFGLHASMTLGERTLERCGGLGRDLGAGFHVHVAEAECDVEATRKLFGAELMPRFEAAGITGPRSIFAHGIHLDDGGLEILRGTGSMLVTNPESNMNNGLAVTPAMEALKKNICLLLGTDGMAPNLIAQARALYLIQRTTHRDPRIAFGEAVQALLLGNRDACRRIFKRARGALQPGCLADLALFPYTPFTPFEAGTWMGHLLFGLVQTPARTTICRGEVIVENGGSTRMDEVALRAATVERARALWQRIA